MHSLNTIPTRRVRERCSAQGRDLGAAPRRLAVDLTPQAIEQVAARVVALLREHEAQSEPDLISAGELARRLRVERPWVYRRWKLLGGIRLDEGPKAPLRFDYGVAMTRLRKLQEKRPEGGERR